MVGRLSILKKERDIGLQGGLIAFDGEVVVGFPAHHIRGQLALREERIGGDVLSLNVDAVEQRDEPSDFIGLLGFFLTFYGQGTDFFWV